MNTARL